MGFPWQLARWQRVVPGRLGAAFLLVPPILFFLPLGAFGFFTSWRQGAVAIASLATVALAMALGRDSGRPHPTEFWVYQKGISLADWGFSRWLLDAALAASVAMLWVGSWSLAAVMAGEPISLLLVLALLLWLFSLYAMTGAILFVIGAAGSSRSTDICILLLILAALEPVLARGLPSGVATAAHLLLPPLLTAVNARIQLGSGETIRSVLPAFLHVGAYVAVLLSLGTFLLARRRPEEGRQD